MDRCPECGFDYEGHGASEIPGEIGANAERLASIINPRLVDPTVSSALRRRPEPLVWSPLEYACHVRDVFLTQRERLFLTLVEETPSFAPMYRDERAVRANYASEDPSVVASEIGFGAELLRRSFSGLATADWGRTCMYNYPVRTERTLLWLAQNTLHESQHHLLDVERILST